MTSPDELFKGGGRKTTYEGMEGYHSHSDIE